MASSSSILRAWAAHHGVDGAESLCHDFAELFRHERKHLDDVFGLSGEELAQFGFCVAIPTGQVFRWHFAS